MSRLGLASNIAAIMALGTLDHSFGEIKIEAPRDGAVTRELRDLPKPLHPLYRKNKYTPHIGKKQIAKNKRKSAP